MFWSTSLLPWTVFLVIHKALCSAGKSQFRGRGEGFIWDTTTFCSNSQVGVKGCSTGLGNVSLIVNLGKADGFRIDSHFKPVECKGSTFWWCELLGVKSSCFSWFIIIVSCLTTTITTNTVGGHPLWGNWTYSMKNGYFQFDLNPFFTSAADAEWCWRWQKPWTSCSQCENNAKKEGSSDRNNQRGNKKGAQMLKSLLMIYPHALLINIQTHRKVENLRTSW